MQLRSKIATQVFGMRVGPDNEFGLATPLQPRPALCTFYYLDIKAVICIKTKIIRVVIYCNTSCYTYVNTLYYNAKHGSSSTRVLCIVLAIGKFVIMRNIFSKITLLCIMTTQC